MKTTEQLFEACLRFYRAYDRLSGKSWQKAAKCKARWEAWVKSQRLK